jgi:DNA mismatch repair protein MutS
MALTASTDSKAKMTPMIEQYLSIKEQYKDAILFYRMGDFYEMFYDDAELTSRVLEIALTSRNKNNKDPVPMCGVPVKAVKGYLAKLIGKGYKVAICDQIEDPSKAKGLVKRDVVRVVTPGMITEDELLDAKSNNYILGLFWQKSTVGISFLDLSTGTFRVSEYQHTKDIMDEILRISPSEILFPESLKHDAMVSDVRNILPGTSTTFLPARAFEYKQARERLLEQFHTVSLEGFGCEQMKTGVSAAGGVLFYVRETQKQDVSHVSCIQPYRLDNFLLVDDISCRNLELLSTIRTDKDQGTLVSILDHTVTPMGGRLLRQWLRYPLMEKKQILARLDAVEEAKKKQEIRNRIRETLKSVYDLERLGGKVALGRCNARDLVALKRSLMSLPDILSISESLESGLFFSNMVPDRLNELAELIESAIRDDAPPTLNEGGLIKSGYNEELDELIQISRDGKGFLAGLEAKEKEKTGINSLKVRYNKVFGYYIEVSKIHTESVPDYYVRKQTLVNAERYITDELKSFEHKVLGAEERRASLEYELFNGIRKEVLKNNIDIQRAAAYLARLDCILNLAEIAQQNDYRRPSINTGGIIDVEEGRHPVIEKMIVGERFVPNSIRMDNQENQILIITGPNMAGKSTVLRQTAILVIMAHMGSFVPARKADIAITDRIFTRVGALDNLSQGQSTFMVEMEETANILNNATTDSLIIMDEIGRGTSTFDGLSIAWAVAEYLHDLKKSGVKTLFATHYHELTDLSLTKNRIKNYNIAVKEWNDEIIFLRKLIEGGTNRSYGIQVARLAGIPDKVVKRAKVVLSRVEEGENNLRNMAVSEKKQKGPVQMDLFRRPELEVTDKIQHLDISRMTPLDALNYLSKLQEKLKDIQ